MASIKLQDVHVELHRHLNKTRSIKETVSAFLTRGGGIGSELVSVLRDITLDVSAGERVGVVGPNGAGKSTLMKTISGIYEPNIGTVEVEGILVPLLELGAGFHQEFSGRENISFNAMMLGMSKKETRALENEIINFSGIGDFADTPVKYYSTGMYLRLAFSIATTVKAEILLLDEIFAGGDIDFATKGKRRINNLVDNAKILVMVSHDLSLIRELCNRVILIEDGSVTADGLPDDVILEYTEKYVR